MNHLCFAFLLLFLIVPRAALATDAADSDEPLSHSEELLDGPFEGAGSIDETSNPSGITGDWGGARTWLFERGVELSVDLTQGVQGVMDGGFDEEAEYLGSSEWILDVDSEKLGLWPGGFWRVAAEGRFGSDVLGEAGTFSPVNNDALFPADPGRSRPGGQGRVRDYGDDRDPVPHALARIFWRARQYDAGRCQRLRGLRAE